MNRLHSITMDRIALTCMTGPTTRPALAPHLPH